jgi:TolB protein
LKPKILTIAILAAATAWPIASQRKPVLPQIDLPHPYYFREMYLPQLTSGPSSVAWSPDSREVVYSMAGSLWREEINGGVAQQLTDGPGYDYQPDWSPDGKSIVYVSYQKDAMELWLLDLATGRTEQLTSGGAVNVEPRWSPDGKQIVFVSTTYNKRFHIFRADVQSGKLGNVTRLTGETRSPLPRYYYSAFDHEISPVWSRDGKEILFVSNRGHIYGTGGFWRMKTEPGAEAREIHYEETTWKARPDFSPEGSRIVYSSYLGRQWHQLWVMPANGGDAFPVSYGDWDETNVRWSPDGEHLAFISNRSGNTELWLESIPGADQRKLQIAGRKYLRPTAHLHLKWHDAGGAPFAARISITDAAGHFYAPTQAWIHADDGYDRGERTFEAHYFHTAGEEELELPAGKFQIEVMKGFEEPPTRTSMSLEAGKEYRPDVTLFAPHQWSGLGDAKWISSDLHVHMNYGGTYRNTPAHLVEQAEAENLGFVNDLIVNKEQRFPDIAFSGLQTDLASKPDALVVHGQEFHTSYWGHLALLNIHGNILLPGYAGYPNTAAASLFPTNADVADMGHAHGALAGYVHPFEEEPQPLATPPQTITNELPVDVALGKVDYMEIVGFSDHRSTAAVWYRLLNLGFRIPAGAGTDAMANFASLRGPVGMNRVYLRLRDKLLNAEASLDALKNGATFATNGPLLDFSLGGQEIGSELNFAEPQGAVPFRVKLRSIVPLNHFEIVCNGKTVKKLALPPPEARIPRGSKAGGDFYGTRFAEASDEGGTVPLQGSGWCVLRASSDKAEYPVLDNYVYATTSPIYVTIGGKPPRSTEDAKYFVAWIKRVEDVTSHYPDWNSAGEKEGVLKQLARAKEVFEKLR